MQQYPGLLLWAPDARERRADPVPPPRRRRDRRRLSSFFPLDGGRYAALSRSDEGQDSPNSRHSRESGIPASFLLPLLCGFVALCEIFFLLKTRRSLKDELDSRPAPASIKGREAADCILPATNSTPYQKDTGRKQPRTKVPNY